MWIVTASEKDAALGAVADIIAMLQGEDQTRPVAADRGSTIVTLAKSLI
jgi:hypothetical protein